MNYRGDIRLGDTIDFKFTSRRFTTGAPFTLAGSPVLSCYVGNGTTEITAGITLSVDFDGRTGLNQVRIVASSGNGYALATNVDVVITTGTVDGVSVVGEVVGSFSIMARMAAHVATYGMAQSATAGTIVLDASTASSTDDMYNSQIITLITGTGAGQTRVIVDYVGSTKTATLDRNWLATPDGTSVYSTHNSAPRIDADSAVAIQTGTAQGQLDITSGVVKANATQWLGGTIPAVNVTGVPLIDLKYTLGTISPATAGSVRADSVTGNVGGAVVGSVGSVSGNVSGTVASVVGSVGSVLGAVGSVAGNVGGSVASVVGAVGSVTGSVASVVGSVGSVTGAVGSVTGNVGGNVAGALGGSVLGGVSGNVIGSVGSVIADVGITQAGADKVWSTAARSLTTFGTLVADTATAIWGAATRILTAGTNIVLAKGTGVTGFNDLDAAGVRTAVGLASANLDWQLAGISAPSAATVADAVWDEVLSGHLTALSTGAALNAAGAAGDPWATAIPGAYGAGTAGKIVGDNLDAAITTRTKPADTQAAVTTVTNLTNAATAGDFTATMKTSLNSATPASVVGAVGSVTGLTASDVAAIKAKTDNLPASPSAVGDVPTAAQNADKLLGRNIAGGSDGGRIVTDALRPLRNKTSIAAGTMTVCEEDDSTTAWTAAVTTTPGDPLSAIDPA